MTEQLGGTRGSRSASTPFEKSEWVRVGQTVRALRELRGFDPQGFADMIGIGRTYLVNIELGYKKLTNVLLAKFAEVLGVPQIAIMYPDSAKADADDPDQATA